MSFQGVTLLMKDIKTMINQKCDREKDGLNLEFYSGFRSIHLCQGYAMR